MPTTKPKIVKKIKVVEPVLVNKIETPVQVPDISHAPPPSLDIEPMPCVCVEDNANLTILELRKLCKDRGIKGYSKLKKADLLNLLV